MVVLNQHFRRFHAPPETMGKLLDTLASRSDAIWPQERWPPMRFDGPIGIGATGGHGPIRYSVQEYDPGRSITFLFHKPEGFSGTHRFVVKPSAQGCELRHVIAMQVSGGARVSWPFLFRPLHDALLEDALDKAEASVTGESWHPRTLPLSVRALRWLAARRKPDR